MTTLYGIPQCDSVRKARAWLQSHHRVVEFHDFKKSGVPPERVDVWLRALGWERLVNRKGTTWRRLGDAQRALVVDAESARRLMLDESSVIKRPVVEWADGAVTVGFDPEDWASRR